MILDDLYLSRAIIFWLVKLKIFSVLHNLALTCRVAAEGIRILSRDGKLIAHMTNVECSSRVKKQGAKTFLEHWMAAHPEHRTTRIIQDLKLYHCRMLPNKVLHGVSIGTGYRKCTFHLGILVRDQKPNINQQFPNPFVPNSSQTYSVDRPKQVKYHIYEDKEFLHVKTTNGWTKTHRKYHKKFDLLLEVRYYENSRTGLWHHLPLLEGESKPKWLLMKLRKFNYTISDDVVESYNGVEKISFNPRNQHKWSRIEKTIRVIGEVNIPAEISYMKKLPESQRLIIRRKVTNTIVHITDEHIITHRLFEKFSNTGDLLYSQTTECLF